MVNDELDKVFSEMIDAVYELLEEKYDNIDAKFTLGDFHRIYFSADNQTLKTIVSEVEDEMDNDHDYIKMKYPIAFCIWLSMKETIGWRIDREIGDNALVSISPRLINSWDDYYGHWKCIYLISADKDYNNFYTRKIPIPNSVAYMENVANALLPAKYAHYVSLNQHIPKEVNARKICDSYKEQASNGFDYLRKLFSEYMGKTILPEHLNLLLDKCRIFDYTGARSSYSRKDFLREIHCQYVLTDNLCPKRNGIFNHCKCKDEFCYGDRFSCPIKVILDEYDKKAKETEFYTKITISDIAKSCTDKTEISKCIKERYLSNKESILKEEEKKRKKREKRKARMEKTEDQKKKEYDERCADPYIGPRQTDFIETDELDNIIVHYKFKRQIPDEIISKYIYDHDYLMKETIEEIKSHKNKYKYAYGIIGACEVYGIDSISGEFGTASIILRKKDFTVTPYTDDVAHELAEKYALGGKEEKDDLLIGGPVERIMDNYLDNQFL